MSEVQLLFIKSKALALPHSSLVTGLSRWIRSVSCEVGIHPGWDTRPSPGIVHMLVYTQGQFSVASLFLWGKPENLKETHVDTGCVL